ncbi:hypothetical protein OHB12_30220 [Nocardia sp. NBC_01730]|uniref:hypothetical protein n=1 Tax=Nocardia sp. NBC_01730 TaxID=2975998 RepID=UPI002E0DC3B1|nr:hypothetical protein OHB12_30220 [Nocardia sp. NBC_01730]
MRRRVASGVVAMAAVAGSTACGGQQAPPANSGVTPSADATTGAPAGMPADLGPRHYAGGAMVVVPHSADLEPSSAMAFSAYDIEDGTERLAIHIPGPVGCPSIGFTAQAEESAELVTVKLIRGLHRGMPPCQGANPEQKREYGVVVVDLQHPLGNRTVLSLA